jgi:hypothetical protein
VSQEPIGGPDADRFLELACLTHAGTDAVERRQQAEALLRSAPALVRQSVHVAAAVGDVAALRAHLDARPQAVGERAGPRGWVPLLYLCSGRVDAAGSDAVAAVRLLLERGADAGAHAIMTGGYRYTAVTWAVGVGEPGPIASPPHAQARALVELLLDAGADANDSQALYNTHFLPDNQWLALFLARGLDAVDRINWSEAHAGVPMLEYLLGAAARQGFVDRVALLLAHGASPDGRDFYNHRTHLENARLFGHGGIAEMLVRHGAGSPSFSPGEALRVACLAGDEAEVRRLGGLTLAGRDDVATLLAAAQHGHLRAVRLCLDVLGVDVDATSDKGIAALHIAAGNGRRLVVEELLGRGASLALKDAEHGGTPLGHARWAARTWPTPERRDVARLLEAMAAPL